MRTYLVPILLLVILFASFLYLMVDKFATGDVHVLLEREIRSLKSKPHEVEIKTYTHAVKDVVTHVNLCLASSEEGICRDTHALELVRALKLSDSLYTKTPTFKRSPFEFFERSVAPKMGIDELRCHLENKKPVCRVVRG